MKYAEHEEASEFRLSSTSVWSLLVIHDKTTMNIIQDIGLPVLSVSDFFSWGYIK